MDDWKIKFELYHAENPDIYRMFKQFTFEAISSGRKYFGANAIIERIRWATMIEAKNDLFKINNNYAPFYSRLFENEYPKHKGFFRKRHARADENFSDSLF
jgi:hypothetical protein